MSDTNHIPTSPKSGPIEAKDVSSLSSPTAHPQRSAGDQQDLPVSPKNSFSNSEVKKARQKQKGANSNGALQQGGGSQDGRTGKERKLSPAQPAEKEASELEMNSARPEEECPTFQPKRSSGSNNHNNNSRRGDSSKAKHYGRGASIDEASERNEECCNESTNSIILFGSGAGETGSSSLAAEECGAETHLLAIAPEFEAYHTHLPPPSVLNVPTPLKIIFHISQTILFVMCILLTFTFAVFETDLYKIQYFLIYRESETSIPIRTNHPSEQQKHNSSPNGVAMAGYIAACLGLAFLTFSLLLILISPRSQSRRAALLNLIAAGFFLGGFSVAAQQVTTSNSHITATEVDPDDPLAPKQHTFSIAYGFYLAIATFATSLFGGLLSYVTMGARTIEGLRPLYRRVDDREVIEACVDPHSFVNQIISPKDPVYRRGAGFKQVEEHGESDLSSSSSTTSSSSSSSSDSSMSSEEEDDDHVSEVEDETDDEIKKEGVLPTSDTATNPKLRPTSKTNNNNTNSGKRDAYGATSSIKRSSRAHSGEGSDWASPSSTSGGVRKTAEGTTGGEGEARTSSSTSAFYPSTSAASYLRSPLLDAKKTAIAASLGISTNSGVYVSINSSRPVSSVISPQNNQMQQQQQQQQSYGSARAAGAGFVHLSTPSTAPHRHHSHAGGGGGGPTPIGSVRYYSPPRVGVNSSSRAAAFDEDYGESSGCGYAQDSSMRAVGAGAGGRGDRSFHHHQSGHHSLTSSPSLRPSSTSPSFFSSSSRANLNQHDHHHGSFSGGRKSPHLYTTTTTGGGANPQFIASTNVRKAQRSMLMSSNRELVSALAFTPADAGNKTRKKNNNKKVDNKQQRGGDGGDNNNEGGKEKAGSSKNNKKKKEKAPPQQQQQGSSATPHDDKPTTTTKMMGSILSTIRHKLFPKTRDDNNANSTVGMNNTNNNNNKSKSSDGDTNNETASTAVVVVGGGGGGPAAETNTVVGPVRRKATMVNTAAGAGRNTDDWYQHDEGRTFSPVRPSKTEITMPMLRETACDDDKPLPAVAVDGPTATDEKTKKARMDSSDSANTVSMATQSMPRLSMCDEHTDRLSATSTPTIPPTAAAASDLQQLLSLENIVRPSSLAGSNSKGNSSSSEQQQQKQSSLASGEGGLILQRQRSFTVAPFAAAASSSASSAAFRGAQQRQSPTATTKPKLTAGVEREPLVSPPPREAEKETEEEEGAIDDEHDNNNNYYNAYANNGSNAIGDESRHHHRNKHQNHHNNNNTTDRRVVRASSTASSTASAPAHISSSITTSPSRNNNDIAKSRISGIQSYYQQQQQQNNRHSYALRISTSGGGGVRRSAAAVAATLFGPDLNLYRGGAGAGELVGALVSSGGNEEVDARGESSTRTSRHGSTPAPSALPTPWISLFGGGGGGRRGSQFYGSPAAARASRATSVAHSAYSAKSQSRADSKHRRGGEPKGERKADDDEEDSIIIGDEDEARGRDNPLSRYSESQQHHPEEETEVVVAPPIVFYEPEPAPIFSLVGLTYWLQIVLQVAAMGFAAAVIASPQYSRTYIERGDVSNYNNNFDNNSTSDSSSFLYVMAGGVGEGGGAQRSYTEGWHFFRAYESAWPYPSAYDYSLSQRAYDEEKERRKRRDDTKEQLEEKAAANNNTNITTINNNNKNKNKSAIDGGVVGGEEEEKEEAGNGITLGSVGTSAMILFTCEAFSSLLKTSAAITSVATGLQALAMLTTSVFLPGRRLSLFPICVQIIVVCLLFGNAGTFVQVLFPSTSSSSSSASNGGGDNQDEARSSTTTATARKTPNNATPQKAAASFLSLSANHSVVYDEDDNDEDDNDDALYRDYPDSICRGTPAAASFNTLVIARGFIFNFIACLVGLVVIVAGIATRSRYHFIKQQVEDGLMSPLLEMDNDDSEERMRAAKGFISKDH